MSSEISSETYRSVRANFWISVQTYLKGMEYRSQPRLLQLATYLDSVGPFLRMVHLVLAVVGLAALAAELPVGSHNTYSTAATVSALSVAVHAVHAVCVGEASQLEAL